MRRLTNYKLFLLEKKINELNTDIDIPSIKSNIDIPNLIDEVVDEVNKEGGITKKNKSTIKKLYDYLKSTKSIYLTMFISLLMTTLVSCGHVDNLEEAGEIAKSEIGVEVDSDYLNNSNHYVVKGETIYSISKLYGISPKDIVLKNKLSTTNILPGQELEIPNDYEVDGYKDTPTPEILIEKDKIEDGMFLHDKVINNRIKRLEIAKTEKFNGIVLHRTVTTSLEGTLKGFERRRVGTHFLVGYDGKIYQTASLDYMTAHILNIRSRCLSDNSCSLEDEEIISKIKKYKGKKRYKSLHLHEIKKEYPERYPYNKDAIGIEVMGYYDKGNEEWETLTKEQIESVKFLVKLLQRNFNMKDSDVYTHEEVSYKTEGEGGEILKAINIKR